MNDWLRHATDHLPHSVAEKLSLLSGQGWQTATQKTAPKPPETAQNFRLWLLEKVLLGQPYFESAERLAQRCMDARLVPAEQVAKLVRREVSRGFGVGFATGLLGPLGAPVGIPVALAATFLIQARLAAAIAFIFGHDLQDEAVQTAILSALGQEERQTPKQVEATQPLVFQTWMQKASGPLLALGRRRAGKVVSQRLTKTRAAQLARALPVLGAVAGGSVDAMGCLKVAERAQRLFQPTYNEDCAL